jgi:hypothetical protein
MTTNGLTKRFNHVRALMMIHLVLVLLIPFLFTQMGGCQAEKDTLPLNLGPEVDAELIDQALSAPLRSTTPLSIRLGEGFVLSETQELGGIAGSYAVLSDTSQTVVDRVETESEVLMTIIEHRQTYSNGEVKKTSTEIPVRIEKTATEALMYGPEVILPSLTTPTTEKVTSQNFASGHTFRPEIEKLLRERSPQALLGLLREQNSQNKSGEISIRGDGAKVSYHGLQISEALEAPPVLVQRRENCAGLPNCQLRVHRVRFDMVFWENGRPDRVHWEFAMSAEAPYLASVLEKCVTGLAKLGGNQGEILVRQCLPVIDFRFTN